MTLVLISTCSPANAGSGKSVPVMTEFTVKLDQAVSPDKAANGTSFTASLKQPVEVDGRIIIPAGASAGGILSKESPNSPQMELNSVFVNGRLYRITTEPVSISHKSALRAGATLTFRLMLSLIVK
ncbi:MAG TPA: hypothetical protein VGI45_18230 [Terracidiphilus sp.]